MIIESICRFATNMLVGLIGMISPWELPTELLSSLANILKYGSWVVGSDVLLLFTGSVLFWWSVKASVGIGIWIYDKLPLT